MFHPSLFLLGSLLLCTPVYAQFKLSAEIRPRAEIRNGFKRPLGPEEHPAFFIEQRSRLYVEYHDDRFDLMLSPQDVRIWGDNDQASKTDRALTSLQQAWAAYKFNDKNRLMAGRMELDYDNARLLGNLDWAQQGRSHDVLKYEYNTAAFRFHAAAAFNQDTHTPEPNKLAGTYYSGLNNYKNMQFLWLHKEAGKLSLSGLVMNEGRQYAPDTVYYLQTGGLYAQLKLTPVTFSVEYYYQGGKNSKGTNANASLAALQASATVYPGFSIDLGYDYLSGDDPSTPKQEAFDPLYGTQHKFYGNMDYFYAGNSHQNAGLSDAYTKLAYHTHTQRMQLDVHRFAATSTNIAPDLRLLNSGHLGWEMDFTYTYQVNDAFRIQGGYSHLIYTDAMQQVKQTMGGSNDASWAWLMFTFKPALFHH